MADQPLQPPPGYQSPSSSSSAPPLPAGYAETPSGLLVPEQYAAPLITRTPMFDDDGSGEVGTVINNAWKQELYNQIDAANAGTYNAAVAAATAIGATTTTIYSTATGTVNDWAPGLNGHTVIYWSGAADLTVTGMAGGVIGQLLTICNTGNGPVLYLPYASTNSAAANRLWNFASSGATPLAMFGTATYRYSGSIWKLITHEQGKPIGVPYNAANFTCDTGTYTVPSGSLSIYNYSLSGTRLKITIFASNGSIAGSPTVLIHGGWPFQFANYDFATGFVTTTSPTALAPSRMYGNPNASTIAMFYPAGGFTANNGATIIQAGGWFTVN